MISVYLIWNIQRVFFIWLMFVFVKIKIYILKRQNLHFSFLWQIQTHRFPRPWAHPNSKVVPWNPAYINKIADMGIFAVMWSYGVNHFPTKVLPLLYHIRSYYLTRKNSLPTWQQWFAIYFRSLEGSHCFVIYYDNNQL